MINIANGAVNPRKKKRSHLKKLWSKYKTDEPIHDKVRYVTGNYPRMAEQLWVYNVKTRKLGLYKAQGAGSQEE